MHKLCAQAHLVRTGIGTHRTHIRLLRSRRLGVRSQQTPHTARRQSGEVLQSACTQNAAGPERTSALVLSSALSAVVPFRFEAAAVHLLGQQIGLWNRSAHIDLGNQNGTAASPACAQSAVHIDSIRSDQQGHCNRRACKSHCTRTQFHEASSAETQGALDMEGVAVDCAEVQLVLQNASFTLGHNQAGNTYVQRASACLRYMG